MLEEAEVLLMAEHKVVEELQLQVQGVMVVVQGLQEVQIMVVVEEDQMEEHQETADQE